jgi:hypothetical protein
MIRRRLLAGSGIVVLVAAIVFLPWWLRKFDLRIELVDADTGQPVSARLQLRTPDGLRFTKPDARRLTHTIGGIGPYLHVDGVYQTRSRRGHVGLIVTRGMTYEIEQHWYELSRDTTITVPVRPWIDPRAWGWISGEPHLHPEHAGGRDYDVAIGIDDCARAARGEGLDVMFLLANRLEHPSGPVDPPAPDVTLVWGEEFRNGFWGHVVMLDVPELVVTGYGAAACGTGQPAWPTLEATLTEHRPPIAYMAHPHTTDHPEDTHYWPGSGYARELPALATRPRLDGVAVVGATNGPHAWYLDPWLDGLRLGRRWAAIGESDRALDRYRTGPPGDPRTYVWIEDPLPTGHPRLGAQWLQGLAQGRTYATTGPVLQTFEVAGVGPGGLVDVAPGEIPVRVRIHSRQPLEEIVLLGAEGIHLRWPWPAAATHVDTLFTVGIEHDDFVALQARSSAVWFAHQFPAALVTTPVWIRTGDPWQVPEDVLVRGRDALARFWQSSLDDRGYASAADSAKAYGQVAAAGSTYARWLEPPGAFVSLTRW